MRVDAPPRETAKAIRDVVLVPAFGRRLREHKLASCYCGETDFVFASLPGTGLEHRNVARRGLEPALRRAGLDAADKPRFRFHDCRHTFASLLIAEGLDVVFVSRQLGHANPAITLSVYSHLFDRQRHADRTRDALEAAFGTIVERNGGDGRQPEAKAEVAEVVSLLGFAAVSDWRRRLLSNSHARSLDRSQPRPLRRQGARTVAALPSRRPPSIVYP